MKRQEKLLTDFIRVYNYKLEKEYEAIKKLKGWEKHRWYSAASQQSWTESQKELDVRMVHDEPAVFAVLNDCLLTSAKRYAIEFFSHSHITSLSWVRLNRYKEGSLMRPHVDHIHSLFDGEAKGIPAVSLVGVLNDDYTGGDLVICGEPYRLKPGQIIAWPSCFLYPHEVTEITSGTRYSFVSWAW